MLTIIFENNDFIVIDKPPNIGFHNEEDTGGIFSILKKQMNTNSLYPVHRLDKVTSGVLVFAKNSDTAAEFGNLFNTKQLEKFYLAISNNKPTKKQGTIKGDMIRSRRSSWKLTKTTSSPAVTQFFSYSMNNGLRLFLIRLLTGKTHQIRVALKSISAPICGDPIYSSNSSNYDRTYLHSYLLKFTLKNKHYEFKSVPDSGNLFLSEDFADTLSNIDDISEIRWPKYTFPIKNAPLK